MTKHFSSRMYAVLTSSKFIIHFCITSKVVWVSCLILWFEFANLLILKNLVNVSTKCKKLRIWSHLLKKSLMENFIFDAVIEVFILLGFFLEVRSILRTNRSRHQKMLTRVNNPDFSQCPYFGFSFSQGSWMQNFPNSSSLCWCLSWPSAPPCLI